MGGVQAVGFHDFTKSFDTYCMSFRTPSTAYLVARARAFRGVGCPLLRGKSRMYFLVGPRYGGVRGRRPNPTQPNECGSRTPPKQKKKIRHLHSHSHSHAHSHSHSRSHSHSHSHSHSRSHSHSHPLFLFFIPFTILAHYCNSRTQCKKLRYGATQRAFLPPLPTLHGTCRPSFSSRQEPSISFPSSTRVELDTH